MPEVYETGQKGRCPHCRTTVQFVPNISFITPSQFSDDGVKATFFRIHGTTCPECKRPTVSMETHELRNDRYELIATKLVWPVSSARPPLPAGIDQHLVADYQQAALVLPFSEKASAALSRRCLQSMLREAGQTTSKDLADQIEEVLPSLPGYLQTQLDAVRHIGNFAAHPQKSRATGEILDVEPGEAEWNLDVLDLLFDFYYEQPRLAQQKRDALNKKLAEVGKPPMK